MSKLKLKYPEDQHYSTTDDDLDTDDQGDIIRCVCHSTTDDGFTIQCESCDTWQHAKCVNIKKKAIPEHYVCERCKKKTKKKQTRRRNSSDEDIKVELDRKKKVVKRDKKRVDSGSEEESKRTAFVPITKSVMKEKLREDLFIEVHRQWIELNWPKAASGSKKYTTSSITPHKSLDSIIVMESNLLLPAIPKASVKPIRRSLRGSFSFHNQNDPSIPKGIFADIHIPKNRYLMEVTGEALRKSEYKADTRNKFHLLGTPLPRVFFYPSLDFCIDSRYTGNETRFIRRSCYPNSELKSIILPNDNEDHSIHMGIYTKDEVDKGEEITIGWNWHKGQLMWRKNKEFKDLALKGAADIMDESEKESLREVLGLINSKFGKCACEDEEDCLFEYLKEELERETAVKKTKPNIIKSRKPIPATRANIFTSDEDDEIKPAIPEKKRVQFIDKSAKASIPSSPAISIDIDITTMSPTPNTSENESDLTTGSKRTRPTSAILKLPCKKRWLYKFISQQEKITPPKIEAPELVDDQADLSDGESSESTLPLDDTHQPTHEAAVGISAAVDVSAAPVNVPVAIVDVPVAAVDVPVALVDVPVAAVDVPVAAINVPVAAQDISDIKPLIAESTSHTTHQSADKPSEPEQQYISSSIIAESIKSDKDVPQPLYNEDSHTSQPIINESASTNEGIASPDQKSKEKTAPKVKLSIQEYLKRQRGNLPTPDENNN